MENSTLYHHGILGQKWGVRRYQNADGTRTSAGKKRERASKSPEKMMSDEELQAKNKRLAAEATYRKLSGSSNKSSLERTKDIIDDSNRIVNQVRNSTQGRPEKEKLDLSNMTDQELRDRINRANLERQYNDMFAPETQVSKGRQYVNDIMNTTGAILSIGSSALAIALTIQQMRK